MTQEAKKAEPKKEKINFHEELKKRRMMLTALRKDIEQKASLRKDELKKALNASLSQRQKAMNEFKAKADTEKEKFKLVYNTAKKLATENYEASLANITKERDELIEAAHGVKEGEYRRINEQFRKSSEPLFEKYRKEIKALDEKYLAGEEQHEKAGEEAIKTLQAEIEALEVEIAKRSPKKAETKESSDAAQQPGA